MKVPPPRPSRGGIGWGLVRTPIQGDADEFGITGEYAEGFGQMLRDHGLDTRVVVIEGGDHHATYQAPVVAHTILTWLRKVER